MSFGDEHPCAMRVLHCLYREEPIVHDIYQRTKIFLVCEGGDSYYHQPVCIPTQEEMIIE